MTTLTAKTAAALNLPQILASLALGAALIFAAGFASSQTLHDTAHDLRHATGFACH